MPLPFPAPRPVAELFIQTKKAEPKLRVEISRQNTTEEFISADLGFNHGNAHPKNFD
jgi:hypothetical protein